MNHSQDADQGGFTAEGASGSPDSALSKARSYLQRAEVAINDGHSAAAGHLAAIAGGFVQLAAAEREAAASAGQRERRARPGYDGEAPRGEAAHWLEGDDEIFTAEPKSPRCTGCFGPFSDGTHGPGCTQRCQDRFGAPDGPGACHCRDEALRADRHAEITEAEASEADRG